MTYSIAEIAHILGLPRTNLVESQIGVLLTDSRQVFYADQSLFFALKTANNDGHKYISELYGMKVRNFVVKEMNPEWKKFPDANFLVVKNPLQAMQRLVAYHRQKFDIPVIGITGSNGKTIVKEWLYQLLRDDYTITRSPRSYNSQIGVPLSVWKMNEQTQLGIFEAGISQVEEMANLQGIIRPTIGILTNIGEAHQENFSSLQQKCLEKLELFRHADVIICDGDNPLVQKCLDMSCLSQKAMTWTRKPDFRTDSPLQILQIEKNETKTRISYSILQFAGEFEIPFTDEASIENAINCLAAVLYLKAPSKDIAERMKKLEPVAMRLDVRPGKNNCILVNDSYNSDINSLEIALGFLEQRATAESLRKVVILSDIPQSGMLPKTLYHRVAELIDNKGVDKIIGIGEEITRNAASFHQQEKSFFETTDQFIRSGVWKSFHNELILLKGSRQFNFEKIDECIEEKIHETVMEIDLDAVVHNLNFYRSKLKPDTKIVCMVKADAYGSGGSEIAKTLQYHRCDYLAVAIAEEGVRLRQDGIKLPIMVLNPEVSGFETLFEYSLEPEVYNFRILQAFIREANKRGISGYPIHLKIDTGMHRLGFAEGDLNELIPIINQQDGLHVQSVFSHLAASESWKFDDFTTEQIATFKRVAKKIEAGCGYKVLKHILNSAGIERFPDEQLDMVRLGISLYGVSASGLQGPKTVCSLHSTILQIKEIPQNETVGYGRKGILDHDAKIATIRIGYADGLKRQLGNGVGHVAVNGHKAPIVGNICMDLSMIDVTGLEVEEGDSVEIFGQNISVIDVAERISTIPYEILTSISPRVKRVYFKE
jgi:alanine racemase